MATKLSAKGAKKSEAVLAQERRYREAVGKALEACHVKGWDAEPDDDDANHQFGTIRIWQQFGSQEVSGIIHLTVDSGVKTRIENTSFYSYGQKELLDAISLKLQELPWLQKKSDVERDNKLKEEAERAHAEKERIAKLIRTVLINFDKAVRQLKRRYDGRSAIEIKDEYDVQDFLHALLRAYFDDVRAEEYTPSYAGKTSRIDFLLKQERAAVEVKFATAKLREKEIGDQLIIDIARYQAHTDCDALYCLVYDPDGNIHNPAGFCRDLSGQRDRIAVSVIVAPN